MNSTSNLVRMANQIAANLAVQGEEAAVEGIVQHIGLYWDPRMKAGIAAVNPAELSPFARSAVSQLLGGAA